MSAAIIWIDHSHAKIFNLHPGKVEAENLKKHEVHHHTHGDVAKHKNSDHLYQDVAKELTSVQELLLVGPGTARTEFKHWLDKHQANLAKRVVGNEACDHPTDPQIVALGRKFFKHLDVFTGG